MSEQTKKKKPFSQRKLARVWNRLLRRAKREVK
jgi:hypothetical protein